VKVGVLLPTFRPGANDALAAADEAVRHGLDGVFAYDHLWPMGHPQRPSLAPFPLLAVIARRNPELTMGPLVARVGLVGTSQLVEEFHTLAALAPGRVIATLGTGDKLSEAENLAYGLAPRSAGERRLLVEEAARSLRDDMSVWIGAGAPATNELARSLSVTLNIWDRPVTDVALVAREGDTSWAGNARDDLETHLDGLAAAGASWAVFAPTVDVARLGRWRRTHLETL